MIDTHQHVNWLGRNEEGLIDFLDETDVGKCWLLSWESIDGSREITYKHLSILEIEKTYEKYPNRIIPFCGIDPRRENAEQLLRDYHKKGFKGYGEIKLKILADNPDLVKLLRVAGELGMPAVMHLDAPIPATPQWYLGDILNLKRAADLSPETAVIGHGPGFWREISGDAQERENELYPKGKVTPGGRLWDTLESTPNLYADISGGSGLGALQRDLNYTRKFLTRFREQILYGVDSYSCDTIKFLKELSLDKCIFNDITHNNAERLIK